MKRLVLAATLWVACGIHNWGYTLGDFTHQFPEQINTGISGMGVVAGPLAVPAVLFVSGHRHWLWKPLTTEQRWQSFHKQFPELSREEFEQEDD